MTNRNRPALPVSVTAVDRPGDVPTQREALRALPQVVYAMAVGDHEVKIGCTAALDSRMRILRSIQKQPVTLLAFTPGGFEDEAAIHHRLREHRSRGREFYYRTPAVMAAVNAMRDSLGLPHV